MTLVKGPGERFFDVPPNILEQYAISEQEIKKIRAKATKLTIDEVEDQDVEGYEEFLYDYEGFGYICGFPDKV
jgi:hypothetical protein